MGIFPDIPKKNIFQSFVYSLKFSKWREYDTITNEEKELSTIFENIYS